MKVTYQHGLSWNEYAKPPSNRYNALVLSYNNWDDWGVKSTLNAALFINGETIIRFSLKLLINNIEFTAAHLDKLISEGWNGQFPIPNADYFSVPSDIDFYSALIGKLKKNEAEKVLYAIRDASLLKHDMPKGINLSLIDSYNFRNSLLREAGARKSFEDGWRIIRHAGTSLIKDFTLFIKRRKTGVQPIEFKFNSEILPYDINILIGPNGVGKSYCLKTLVEHWLGIESGSKERIELSGHKAFNEQPNISKLILVSYSPFEEFALDLNNARLLDKSAYKYFGFRQSIERDGEKKIGISRNLPASDSVNSLIKAYQDDSTSSFMSNWIGKSETIHRVLKSTIDFDHLGIEIKPEFEINELYSSYILTIHDKKYIRPDLHYSQLSQYNFPFDDAINKQEGVLFIKDNETIQLSSGQRLFCFIVINVVGEIRLDSLIVIDEPELFLHPTLEIEFISLLKKVLTSYNSKAILATHSLSIARETPSKCVHVFRNLADGLDVIHPPFETFGGDMQRISSYVFSDNVTSKPYDDWLKSKINEYQDAQKLISDLGSEINEEIIMKIINSTSSHGS